MVTPPSTLKLASPPPLLVTIRDDALAPLATSKVSELAERWIVELPKMILPLPALSVSELAPVVLPTVTLWALAPVPIFKAVPEAESTVPEAPPKVRVVLLKTLLLIVLATDNVPPMAVLMPECPILTPLALAAPNDTVPVVPVLVPTSMATLPEAKPPKVTLPEVMDILEVAALALLVVVRLTPPSPCKFKAPEVVAKVEAAFPVKDTAPPVTVMPALPVIKPLKDLAPAQVWAPVLTRPGLVMSAQLKVMTPPLIWAPLAKEVQLVKVPTLVTPAPEPPATSPRTRHLLAWES